MSSKVFRDPLYNYVTLSFPREQWLVKVLNCREVQRLRRIHQLGVSSFTYPGAEHSRLNHSLGVLRLMQLAIEHLSRDHDDAHLDAAKHALLAAALVHDVGHGPFSHLFEPCLDIDHEHWSQAIIKDTGSELHRELRHVDPALPGAVADLINPDSQERPAWQKYLVSSQLDVDRLDYLRRDSLFTGAGYGHFDWHRLITTMELDGDSPEEWEIVWSDKAKFAIEEYVFSRYYMYQNVYLHKTTRGFEQMLIAMWKRAKELKSLAVDIQLMPAIEVFWAAEPPTIRQFMAIEEFTVLAQIDVWRSHPDHGLSDLARRFLDRKPFAMIEAPQLVGLEADLQDWDDRLASLISGHTQYQPAWMYCLKDVVKPKYNQPYFPEKEQDEQSVKNAIRVRSSSGKPVEISTLLPRMRPITEAPKPIVRYYIPHEIRDEVKLARDDWAARPKIAKASSHRGVGFPPAAASNH